MICILEKSMIALKWFNAYSSNIFEYNHITWNLELETTDTWVLNSYFLLKCFKFTKTKFILKMLSRQTTVYAVNHNTDIRKELNIVGDGVSSPIFILHLSKQPVMLSVKCPRCWSSDSCFNTETKRRPTSLPKTLKHYVNSTRLMLVSWNYFYDDVLDIFWVTLMNVFVIMK